MNIYELFNCKNKEEYLNKLYNDEKWRKENKEFFQNLFIDKELLIINSPEALEFIYEDYIIDNKIMIYFQDSSLKLMKIGVYDNFNPKEIVTDLKNLECSSIIIINNTYFDISEGIEWIENIGIIVNDYIQKESIVDNKIKYNKKDLCKSFYIPMVNNEINIKNVEKYNNRRFDRNIMNLISENVKEIVNSNVIGSKYDKINSEKIKDNFKFAYQYDIYESVNMILLDKDNNVNRIVNIGEGKVTESFINIQKIITEIDFEKDTKCILFHNHPSGKLNKSISDTNSTKKIIDILEKIDIELIEHFIVSKEGINTFAVKGDLFSQKIDRKQEFDLRLENNKWKKKSKDNEITNNFLEK